MKKVEPPHDYEAEASVLGSLMLERSFVHEVVDMLHPEDFFDVRHQIIYTAIQTLATSNQPIDPLTIIATLRTTSDSEGKRAGGVEYISDLPARCPSATSVVYYAQLVLDCATRRRMISVAEQMNALAQDPNVTADDVRTRSEGLFYSASVYDRSVAMPEPIALSVNKAMQQYENVRDNGRAITGIPTGIDKLDQMTLGLHPGELTVLAAKSSVGKSGFAAQIATLASTVLSVPVCFFSLEMTTAALMHRILCSVSSISSSNFKYGKLASSDEGRLYNNAEMVRQAPLIIDDQPRMTLSRLRSRARRFAALGQCDLLIVDYLQLIRGDTRKFSGRVDEVTEISGELKQIARELNIPVIALSQLSRASEQRADSRPQLTDLRESGSIGNDADVVLFLHRPHFGKTDATPTEKAQTELIIGKQRNGETGMIPLVFHGDTFTFMPPKESWIT